MLLKASGKNNFLNNSVYENCQYILKKVFKQVKQNQHNLFLCGYDNLGLPNNQDEIQQPAQQNTNLQNQLNQSSLRNKGSSSRY